jgi:hypothetical protein
LRLISVRPRDGTDRSALWRAHESRSLRLAGRLGVSDLASLALDFALLRSLGLVRYHQGAYEVAVPSTGELYKIGGAAPDSTEANSSSDEEVYRRRYFRWLPLGADPIAAVERLALTREQEIGLELFVSPLLGRVRLGHVPRALVTTLLRMRAYAEGRDPTPWEWMAHVLASHVPAEGAACPVRVGADVLFAYRNLARATPPGGDPSERTSTGPSSRPVARPVERANGPSRFDYVPAWARVPSERVEGEHAQKAHEDRAWVGVLHAPVAPALADDAGSATFLVPASMFPDPQVLRLNAAEPGGLLVDAVWLSAYLGADWSSTTEGSAHRIFPTSLYRLGAYDHDSTPSTPERRLAFAGRLRHLSGLVEQGLLRLWSDLERDPGLDVREATDGRGRDGMSEAVLQSLALLGESLVRPAIRDVSDAYAEDTYSDDTLGLPGVPSPALVRMALAPENAQDGARQRLDARLAALGHGMATTTSAGARALLASALLEPADLENVTADLPESPSESAALLSLRAHINRAYRELYNDAFLRKYRGDGGKTVPRLTVVCVGDVSEPFVRATIRTVLREANAELRRTLGPIFSSERGGPQSYVSILPVIWAPHPPDASRKHVSSRVRVLEEAAVHACVHGLRRWLESIPASQRSIRQVYLNGRVTDTTVLDTSDVLDQTCSFLSLVLRNPLEDDPMLRMVHASNSGSSGFATFACRELDFPERRARDYLALRMGIQALSHLRRAPTGERPRVPSFVHGPASAEALSGQVMERLAKLTQEEGDKIAASVRDRAGELDRERAPSELLARFLPTFDAELQASILAVWRRMVRDAGGMDSMVERLRARVLEDARDKLRRFRHDADRVVRDEAAAHGLQHAQVVLATLAGEAQRSLDESARELHEAEHDCISNGVPSTERLPAAREALVHAIERKPDWATIQLGLVWCGGVGLLLGGPMFWAVASYFDLHTAPGLVEGVLYHGGPWLASAGCAALAYAALARFADLRTEAVADACAKFAQAARHTVAGEGAPSSVRSFLRARLALTTSIARHGHADMVQNQAAVDARHATRILRSTGVQLTALRRRLEALGVRIVLRDQGNAEDVSRLFEARDGFAAAPLVSAESVKRYFDESYGPGPQWNELSKRLVDEAGHFDRWREFAPLSETTEVIDVGRRHFRAFIEVPVSAYAGFGEEALAQLYRFVALYRGQLGFGADFDGLEGMDADNNVFVQRRLAVVPEGMADVMEAAHRDDPSRYRHIDRHPALVRANSAWLLSLATCLSSRVIRTLSRYESSLDRGLESPAAAFPYAMEFLSGAEPVTVLAGHVEGPLVRTPLASLPSESGDVTVPPGGAWLEVPPPAMLDAASPVLLPQEAASDVPPEHSVQTVGLTVEPAPLDGSSGTAMALAPPCAPVAGATSPPSEENPLPEASLTPAREPMVVEFASSDESLPAPESPEAAPPNGGPRRPRKRR